MKNCTLLSIFIGLFKLSNTKTWRKECFKRVQMIQRVFGPDFIGSVELWLFDFDDFNT